MYPDGHSIRKTNACLICSLGTKKVKKSQMGLGGRVSTLSKTVLVHLQLQIALLLLHGVGKLHPRRPRRNPKEANAKDKNVWKVKTPVENLELPLNLPPHPRQVSAFLPILSSPQNLPESHPGNDPGQVDPNQLPRAHLVGKFKSRHADELICLLCPGVLTSYAILIY